MLSNIKKHSYKIIIAICLLFSATNSFAQKDEDRLRIDLGVGFGHAFKNGFAAVNTTDDQIVSGKGLNFPALGLGMQYMFNKFLGARLDVGYNRFSNSSESPDFKINYKRINAQAVYDYTPYINLFPEEVTFNAHAGLGYSLVKPLGTIKDNDQSYLNAILGTQVFYELNRNTKAFIDLAYVHGFSNPDDYIAPDSGLGAFNGSIFTFTVGVSLSLSGCYFCN